jgi:diaminohydroxyphosphoribosylaminopyrimidine deaminase/5-amino-6-(5-phosphoribosylamino)uracil reductase
VKWAESRDGRVAGPHGRRLQISGAEATRLVHKLRASYISVIVGVNTILTDDPLLTARGVGEGRGPTRVVLDTNLRLPLDSRLARTAEAIETVVYFAGNVENTRVAEVAGTGLLPTAVERDVSGRVSLRAALADLGHWPMLETLVEAGPTAAKSFFASGEVDRVWVLRSATEIGDATAPRAAEIPHAFVATGKLRLGGDTLIEYLNPASPVFFAAEPSADFVLASGSANQ